MAIKYWLPKALAVAQVSTATITSNSTSTTYTLTINGVSVSVVGNAGGATNTAADLAAAVNASTHPYFAPLTAANNASATVTMTGPAGMPFTVTSSAAPGPGSIGAVATPTAATGPNHWDNTANWSTGTLPANNDEIYIRDSSVSIMWNIAQSAVTLDSLQIDKSFTGKIGLDSKAVATNGDGGTTDATAPEYRGVYLHINSDIADIGKNFGQDNPPGSSRIMLNVGTLASIVTIHSLAQVSSESGRPALRMKCNNASTDIYIRSAIGGYGLAVDDPSETSAARNIIVTDTTTGSRVHVGKGAIITNFKQTGGINVLNGSSTITLVDCSGGDLTIEGDYLITTMTVSGGRVFSNNFRSGAGAAITTLSLTGGQVSSQGSAIARTWTTLNLDFAGKLISDGTIVTITNINEPTKRYTLQMSGQV